MKYAVMLYPNFSLQEITCLTSVLTVWFGEKIDFIASEYKEYISEDGLRVLPTKTTEEAKISDYDCIILPGTITPLPALFDTKLIDFLQSGKDSKVVYAAISSSPILLSKAGVLENKKFTAGFFMQMADTFSFVEKENFIHKGIVADGNVITGIGMFFREFAEDVYKRQLVDFDGDLYGKHLRVELWRYRRPEQRFASLDALKAQMGLDLEATVQFFEERKKPQNK